MSPAPSSSRLDGSGTVVEGLIVRLKEFPGTLKVPKESIGAANPVRSKPPPTQLGGFPPREVVTPGLLLCGSDITADCMGPHPREPKKPVGTMFVLRKLEMVVVVVMIAGTSND